MEAVENEYRDYGEDTDITIKSKFFEYVALSHVNSHNVT